MIVKKEEAILNTPNEHVIALPANHRDLVKFAGKMDRPYLIVRGVLRDIERELRDTTITVPPPTPPRQGQEPPQEEPHQIRFKGFVNSFKNTGLESEMSLTVSELQEKSPGQLLPAVTPSEDEADLPRPYPPRPRWFWVHIPLTNTAWVNVCVP